MADNTVLPVGGGGDTVRDIDRAGVKTQVVIIDIGGEAGPESLVAAGNALPVSAATLPLPTGAAQDSSLATINTTLGSPLQAGGAVSVSNFPTTQPVSGTITTTPPANASTNVAQFGGTNVVTGTGASGAGIPRVTVSSDSTHQVNQGTNAALANAWATKLTDAVTGPVKVLPASTAAAAADVALVVAVSPNNTIPVSGSFFQATQPISAASLPLPANAAQETGGNLAALVAAIPPPPSFFPQPSAFFGAP